MTLKHPTGVSIKQHVTKPSRRSKLDRNDMLVHKEVIVVGRATAHAAPDFPFTIRCQKSWRAGIRNSHGFSRLLLLGSVVDFHRNRCTVLALGILAGYLQGRLYI